MKEGWRRRNSGESEAKHKAQEPPFTPPPNQTFTLCPLISHTGTKESTFPGFSHGTARREGPAGGGQRDEERRENGWRPGLKADRHHRGAIVLYLLTLFL